MNASETSSRLLRGFLGIISILLGMYVGYGSIREIREFWNPASPVWITAVFELAGFLISLGLIAFGYRNLQSGGKIRWKREGPVYRFLIGIGLFFPATIISFPLMLLLAARLWPGDGQSPLAAIVWSPCIGLAATFLYWLVYAARGLMRRAE
jgi:tellurite resistance protein TehA-like permease